MKINIREKEFTIWGIFTLIIIIVWGIVLLLLIESHNKNESAYLEIELKRFEGEIHSTLTTYEAFSNYIYDRIAQDAEVLSIMSQANRTSGAAKDALRFQLYNRLESQYSNMTKYKFRQLHFHLPSTESFLRMHKPEEYGDMLFDIRESVRIANKNKKYVTGFEEGRIYNGFRYVYPLQHNGEHIGTVEVSISSASILEVLSKLYPKEDFHFIINKSVVEEIVFDTEKDNYSNTLISDGFYIDKDVEQIAEKYNLMMPRLEKEFFHGFKEKYSDKIKDNESFSVIYKFNNKDYIVKFLSIKNISNQPTAYLISITETTYYKLFTLDLYKQMFLVTFLAFSIIVFGLMLALYQHRLKNASQFDYLTKLYNRHKFYEIVDTEVKRSRRYKYNSSVMLMDIDYFKMVNDTYGHEWGDQVLKELSKLILKNIRSIDIVARWGGEEFVFLLPHMNKNEALQMAEKIRKLVEDTQVNKLKDITVSIGVVTINFDKCDIDCAIAYADEAMYCAKKSGRNQVCYSVH